MATKNKHDSVLYRAPQVTGLDYYIDEKNQPLFEQCTDKLSFLLALRYYVLSEVLIEEEIPIAIDFLKERWHPKEGLSGSELVEDFKVFVQTVD